MFACAIWRHRIKLRTVTRHALYICRRPRSVPLTFARGSIALCELLRVRENSKESRGTPVPRRNVASKHKCPCLLSTNFIRLNLILNSSDFRVIWQISSKKNTADIIGENSQIYVYIYIYLGGMTVALSSSLFTCTLDKRDDD